MGAPFRPKRPEESSGCDLHDGLDTLMAHPDKDYQVTIVGKDEDTGEIKWAIVMVRGDNAKELVADREKESRETPGAIA